MVNQPFRRDFTIWVFHRRDHCQHVVLGLGLSGSLRRERIATQRLPVRKRKPPKRRRRWHDGGTRKDGRGRAAWCCHGCWTWPTRKPHCSETAFFAKVSHQASTAASAMADRPMSEVVLGRWRSTLEEHAGGGWRTAAPARCNPPHRRTASRGQDKESAYQVVLKTLIGKSNRRRKSNLICVGVQNAYPKLK